MSPGEEGGRQGLRGIGAGVQRELKVREEKIVDDIGDDNGDDDNNSNDSYDLDNSDDDNDDNGDENVKISKLTPICNKTLLVHQ